MLYGLFMLPLADFKTVLAPPPKEVGVTPEFVLSTVAGVGLVALALALLLVGLWMWRTLRHRPAKPATPYGAAMPENLILIDGSNVMHWQDNTAQLAPLLQVIKDLKARGFAPGVVFDANASYELFGKYLNEQELSRMLSLPQDQLLVVPTGAQADPYIIANAIQYKTRIVTNDRFRDWAKDYPQVDDPEFLIWGGIKDGKVWLRYPDLSPNTM
jgi:hypothetical protein